MKFTNRVVKNLGEPEQKQKTSKGRSPPRPFAQQSPKPKARPVATMATGIFIEAIDHSEYRNKYISQANTPLQPVDEKKMYQQLLNYMDVVNTEPAFADQKNANDQQFKKQVLLSS